MIFPSPPNHEVGKIEWPKNEPNIATDFVITDAEIYNKSSDFGSEIKTTNKQYRNKDEAVIFIHGYNNNFAESLYRFAQMSTDMGLLGTPVLYAWPTTENTLEYIHDRDSALFARDGLQTLMEAIDKVRHKTSGTCRAFHWCKPTDGNIASDGNQW